MICMTRFTRKHMRWLVLSVFFYILCALIDTYFAIV